MPYKNPKEILIDATKFPAKVEAMLPNGAPKISTTLADVAARIPTIPDFPMEIPDLPAPPELPALPELPAAPAGLGRLGGPFVGAGARTAPTTVAAERLNARAQREIIPSPYTGLLPEVTSRRGM